MKPIQVLLCSTLALGLSVAAPALASAADLYCAADAGTDITLVNGPAACRARTDARGQARAAGYDGVGYAEATEGASALGIGIAGGRGASDAAGGIPVALGIGPDAVATTSLTEPVAAPPGEAVSPSGPRPIEIPVTPSPFAITIAFGGSYAMVSATERAVTCLGAGALAWDAGTGRACLATPFGIWQRTSPTDEARVASQH
ncbi:hypothetical protein D5S18_12170 [Nocardia panacis]|uniref:Uncharacterized protein n=1 Tax=Nocardia panacis TaxID=2340916 RepID=A0A3A4JZQ0_9NOCA|nr:DUF6764 family protein [Nocardia panacis]RJO76955.1 hypothetical protein D5S18_12170 [Nocardia panacis]